MDADIHTTTPSGSPLLAYGTSTSFFGPRKWLRYAIPGGIGLLFLVICTILYFSLRVHIPQNPLILAVVPGKTDLPTTLPNLWRKAAQSSKLPILLGASLQNKKIIPFVVTFRNGSIENNTPYSQGLFSLYTESPSTTQKWPASILFKQLFSTNKGSIHILPSALHIESPDIVGTLTKNGWETSTSLPTTAISLPTGDLVANLTVFPEATEPIFQALRASGYNFSSKIPPIQNISWQWASGTAYGVRIALINKASPSLPLLDNTALIHTASYKLPDDTVFQEYTNNDSRDSSTTSQSGVWDTENLVWQSASYILQPELKSSCVQGTTVFHLSGEALIHLEHILSIDIPFSQMDISSHQGKMLVCASIH